MKNIWNQLKQYKGNTLRCIGFTALEVVMEILMPFVTAIIIDRGLEVSSLSVVYRYGALMVSFALMEVDLAAILLLVFAYLMVHGLAIYYRCRLEKEM